MKISRPDQILEYMNVHNGNASVMELCEEFGVSDMTIRRDLVALEKLGEIVRYHGGASLLNHSHYLPSAQPFQNRLQENYEEKLALGKAAVRFLEEVYNKETLNSVYIASGSTIYCMTTQLQTTYKDIVYVTDNSFCGQVLGNNPDNTVISIGGELTLPSLNVVGYYAENMIRSFSFDYAFMGVGSIDNDGMIYYYNFIENGTFLATIESAKNIVILADSSKLGNKLFVQCCKMDSRFILITDKAIEEAMHTMLTKAGVRVIIADG